MGWGNYLVLKKDYDSDIKEKLRNVNPAAELARVPIWADGTHPTVVGTDCGPTLTTETTLIGTPVCAVCGHLPCAGCGDQFILDFRGNTPSVKCVGCADSTTIWELLARGEFPADAAAPPQTP